ncbi:response regulator [Plantactinospora solaniradicis]|uniref:Response regulator n=1 Tax=Plantactinospora solaniradicis TaxID=1723736 RepID=A0ABW1KTA9_9ACTN
MRLIIAEDSAVLRDALVELLTTRGHHVAAAVGDGRAVLAAAEQHHPDAVIVDIRMPPTYTDEGLKAAIALRQLQPDLGILLFSQYVETRHVNRLLADDAHGVGYLLKDRVADVREFLDAIARVSCGGTVLDPAVVTHLMAASRHDDPLAALTARERQVLGLMAEGRSNAAIAATLGVTAASVEKHISNVFTRLDLPPSDEDNRRVRAVLLYLKSR